MTTVHQNIIFERDNALNHPRIKSIHHDTQHCRNPRHLPLQVPYSIQENTQRHIHTSLDFHHAPRALPPWRIHLRRRLPPSPHEIFPAVHVPAEYPLSYIRLSKRPPALAITPPRATRTTQRSATHRLPKQHHEPVPVTHAALKLDITPRLAKLWKRLSHKHPSQ
jgi:hypothetical protein